MGERRIQLGFREEPTDEPGLVMGDDGIVYLVAADGTRSPVGNGGSSASVIWQGPYEFDISDYTGEDLGDPDNGFAWIPVNGPALEPGTFVLRAMMDITEAFDDGTQTLTLNLGEALPDGGRGAKWDLQDGDVEGLVNRGVRVPIRVTDQAKSGPFTDTISTGSVAGVFLDTNQAGAALIESADLAWWITCNQWGGGLLVQPPLASELVAGHGRIWLEIVNPTPAT